MKSWFPFSFLLLLVWSLWEDYLLSCVCVRERERGGEVNRGEREGERGERGGRERERDYVGEEGWQIQVSVAVSRQPSSCSVSFVTSRILREVYIYTPPPPPPPTVRKHGAFDLYLTVTTVCRMVVNPAIIWINASMTVGVCDDSLCRDACTGLVLSYFLWLLWSKLTPCFSVLPSSQS